MRRWSARCGQGPSWSPCPCRRPTGPLATSEHEGCGQRGFCRPPNSLRTAHPSGELRMMSSPGCSRAPINTDRRTETQGEVKPSRRPLRSAKASPGHGAGGKPGPSGPSSPGSCPTRGRWAPRGRRPGLAAPAAFSSWAPRGGDQMLVGVPMSADTGCWHCPHPLSPSVSCRELRPFLAHASEWHLPL